MRRLLELALAAAAAASIAGAARADAVTDWVETGRKTGEAARKAGETPSAATARSRPEFMLAMFEAANAVDRRYTSYFPKPFTAPRGASGPAAVAAAGHAVLLAYAPDQKEALDKALKASLASVPDGAGERDGVRLGEEVAKAVLALERVDKRAAAEPYRPATAPGVYVPTTLPVIEPWRATVKPFVLDRIDQFRAPPPPALTSERYTRDLDEVRRLGAKTDSERNDWQTRSASFWAGMDVTPAMRQVADLPGRTLVQNARMYALQAMAQHDTGLAMAESKMHYGFWRPVTAIRNADQDGNDATQRVPGWEPLLNTPMHPEYVCGHCINARTTATVMSREPLPPAGLAFIDDDDPRAPRTTKDWDEYARETSLSRIYAGVHYRFSNDAGEAMGRQVAELVMARFARPIGAAAAVPAERGGGR